MNFEELQNNLKIEKPDEDDVLGQSKPLLLEVLMYNLFAKNSAVLGQDEPIAVRVILLTIPSQGV